MSEFNRPGYAVRLRRKKLAVSNDDYLIHYGIKGQKWGLRRFQNEDRTLTEAGKERYNKKEEKKAAKQAAKEAKEASKPESATWKAKDARFLDDAELNRRNSRLQREKQYIDMTTPQWKKNVKRGAIGIIAALTTVPLAAMASETIKKIYRGKFNEFVAPIIGQKVGLPSFELKNK